MVFNELYLLLSLPKILRISENILLWQIKCFDTYYCQNVWKLTGCMYSRKLDMTYFLNHILYNHISFSSIMMRLENYGRKLADILSSQLNQAKKKRCHLLHSMARGVPIFPSKASTTWGWQISAKCLKGKRKLLIWGFDALNNSVVIRCIHRSTFQFPWSIVRSFFFFQWCMLISNS